MRNSKDWENANKIWADEFLNFAESFISKFNNKMLTARDIKRADAYLNVFIRKNANDMPYLLFTIHLAPSSITYSNWYSINTFLSIDQLNWNESKTRTGGQKQCQSA